MHILFICQRVPFPPNRGDRITTWNFIRHLSKNHQIHLFCLSQDKSEAHKKSELEKLCTTVHIQYKSRIKSYLDMLLALFSTKPLSNAHFDSIPMSQAIKKCCSKYPISVGYVYSSNVFGYVFDLKKIKKIFHLADVDSEKWNKLSQSGPFISRLIYKLEANRLRTWEKQCSHVANQSVLCTSVERELFFEIGARRQATVIKNGVDADYFKPKSQIKKTPVILFTGVMNYYPNIDAARIVYKSIFPLIKASIPQAQFHIVGSNPPPEIQQWAKKDHSCVVTGTVSDMRPYMNQAKIFIAPMRIAQGIQNKILEALSMELPVITFESIRKTLELNETHGVFATDEVQPMSHKAIELLTDEPHRKEIGIKARQAVLKYYSWPTQLKNLDLMLDSVLKDPTETTH